MASNHYIGGKNSGWAPNLYGWFETVYHKTSTITDGTLFSQYEGVQAGVAGGSFLSNYRVCFDSSRKWSGYNNSVTSIMAQNLTILYIIKY